MKIWSITTGAIIGRNRAKNPNLLRCRKSGKRLCNQIPANSAGMSRRES